VRIILYAAAALAGLCLAGADLRPQPGTERGGAPGRGAKITPEEEAALLKTCRNDLDKFCKYAGPSRKKKKCLKENESELSPECGKALKNLRRDFEVLAGIDFFPGAARTQVQAALIELENAAMARYSPGEPHAAPGEIVRLDPARYRGRTWATRRHLWVDRIASAWLIRRFIDPEARFLWLEKPQDCPVDALGFDFDGATFTHVGEKVTFEVLLASLGPENNGALRKLAALVHFLDAGGIPLTEAAGVETVLAGARGRSADDDELLAEAARVFDLLYTAYTE